MDLDYHHSVNRVDKSERYRAQSGFGFTGQASLIVNRYLSDLAEWIDADLKDWRRSPAVRSAVRGLSGEDIACRLLMAGISVAMGKRFGVDEDDNKTPRDTAIWIGYNFVCKTRDAAYRFGIWGIRALCGALPFFKLDDNDILEIVDDGALQALMDGYNAAAHHPLLSPQDVAAGTVEWFS